MVMAEACGTGLVHCLDLSQAPVDCLAVLYAGHFQHRLTNVSSQQLPICYNVMQGLCPT